MTMEAAKIRELEDKIASRDCDIVWLIGDVVIDDCNYELDAIFMNGERLVVTCKRPYIIGLGHLIDSEEKEVDFIDLSERDKQEIYDYVMNL